MIHQLHFIFLCSVLVLSVGMTEVHCFSPADSELSKMPSARPKTTSSTTTTTTAIKVTESSPPVPYDTTHLDLSSGVNMQVLSSMPDQDTDKPPLVFLHGSFHGAWCYAEHYFSYFTEKGYPAVAPDWRGTGGTFAGEDVKKVQIAQHVADLEAFLSLLPQIVKSDKKPIIICHSFGALAVMKALEENPTLNSQLGGLVFMCAVPPSGNGKMTMRNLRRSLRKSYKITVGFAAKRCLKKEDLCRDLFFGENLYLPDGSLDEQGISSSDVQRYQSYFARDSTATIDLLDLAKKLPSAKAVEGKAPFVDLLPPCLVLGGTRDYIVDELGVEETATYFGLEKPVMVDSPHDVMLGQNWQKAADVLSDWLAELQ